MATNDKLHQFGAYQKACELFDFVVADMAPLAREPLCMRLASQQVASADSIASNIEEGYGRASRPDYVRFLGHRPGLRYGNSRPLREAHETLAVTRDHRCTRRTL